MLGGRILPGPISDIPTTVINKFNSQSSSVSVVYLNFVVFISYHFIQRYYHLAYYPSN